MNAVTKSDYLYSSLGTDPDLCDIVDMFVDEMPDRITCLMQLLEASNFDELARMAHQLKGAAGSYGFEAISPAAGKVESAILTGEPEYVVNDATIQLCELCSRVRSGAPSAE